MLIPREQLIAETIKENIGVKKVLDEWQKLINASLPEPKRLTRRSFTHIIRLLTRSRQMVLIKEIKQRNTYYMFVMEPGWTKENEHIPKIQINSLLTAPITENTRR